MGVLAGCGESAKLCTEHRKKSATSSFELPPSEIEDISGKQAHFSERETVKTKKNYAIYTFFYFY
jgi:hypothetical protein